MSPDINQIGTQKVRNVSSGEVLELKSFWEQQNVAIVFFRRWGCMFCRLWAKELSEIAPILKQHNIKLVGVGVEEAGSKEFSEGKFFDGDLYYVENISTYQQLGFKRFNVLTILTSLLWKQSRDAISKGKAMGLKSDLIGDGLQNGGCLLIREGGKMLYRFVQVGPADRCENVEISEQFGLENEYKKDAENEKNSKKNEDTTETEKE
ncbi:prostamide/prostaglandin F synthase isoform X4 [Bombyx mori]|uniref:prostamide/prostaglandin F synthase isoform X4 n=1 Tax=Bombyx mori TaxID=7091 RepID=UPI000B3D1E98